MSNTLTAPEPTFGNITLPRTTLHYVKCGQGPPLIIVPAAVSLISQWTPLAQFMGQRYTSYFFELPGHGGSTPYPEKFNSSMVPLTVEAFVNKLGFDTFNLMGFSFGGLLALRTLDYLQDRIENVILLSPCVSKRAILYSRPRQWLFRQIVTAMKVPRIQHGARRIMDMKSLENILIYAISKASKVEMSILEGKNALSIPIPTMDVMGHTLTEIFSLEFNSASKPFSQKCFFGMSIYDDLLDFDVTIEIVRDHFSSLTTQKFYLPYHQPPHAPTFEWLMEEFGQFLHMLD